MNLRRAVFLDRDGVINVNRPDYIKAWDEFVFLPRALAALRRLAATDFHIIVTTNQSAIARGLTTTETVHAIHAQMLAEVTRAGGRIDAVYFCPHHPDDKCACRKPQVGMFLQAARDFELDLARSFVVGDAFSDIAAALAINAQPILVLTGRGRAQHAEMLANNHVNHNAAQPQPKHPSLPMEENTDKSVLSSVSGEISPSNIFAVAMDPAEECYTVVADLFDAVEWILRQEGIA